MDRSLDEEEWETLIECASRTDFPLIRDRFGRITKKREALYFMKQIIIFARETLMRQGEIFNLKKKDVDFLNGTAVIRKTKNNIPRKIGLSPLAMEQLQSLPTSFDGRYFPVKARHSFDWKFNFILRDAKVDFNFHQLRHMGANDLIMSGWSIAEVQAQGGWKTLKALQRYLHIQAEHLAKKLKERG